MRVAELIAALQKLPQDVPVMIRVWVYDDCHDEEVEDVKLLESRGAWDRDRPCVMLDR